MNKERLIFVNYFTINYNYLPQGATWTSPKSVKSPGLWRVLDLDQDLVSSGTLNLKLSVKYKEIYRGKEYGSSFKSYGCFMYSRCDLLEILGRLMSRSATMALNFPRPSDHS